MTGQVKSFPVIGIGPSFFISTPFHMSAPHSVACGIIKTTIQIHKHMNKPNEFDGSAYVQ